MCQANRLLSVGGVSYAYNGLGQRVSQAVVGTTTAYLLDVQPELAKVLSETTSGSVTRYVHGPRGLLVQENAAGNGEWPVQDRLGSVRGMAADDLSVLESRVYAPYGKPFGTTGTSQTAFGFTGEQMDTNDLVYLRARYHNPEIGAFLSLDPVEGDLRWSTTLNQYGYVEGNPINHTDASGQAVSREKIERGLTSYSCNCGWIDWEHANPINQLNIIRTVKHALDRRIYQGDNSSTGVAFQSSYGTFVGFHLSGHGNPWDPTHQTSAQVLGTSPGGENLLPYYFISRETPFEHWSFISSMIYGDLVQELEKREAEATHPENVTLIGADQALDALHTSAYSVEDLPSYRIGSLIAYLMERYGKADEFYNIQGEEEKNQFVRDFVSTNSPLSDCNIIWYIEINLDIYDRLESRAYRDLKNPSFFPLDRSPELNILIDRGICPESPRGRERLPFSFWVPPASGFGYIRKMSGKQGCSDTPLYLPYPNDPNISIGLVPNELLLYKCGEC